MVTSDAGGSGQVTRRNAAFFRTCKDIPYVDSLNAIHIWNSTQSGLFSLLEEYNVWNNSSQYLLDIENYPANL